MRYFVGSEIGVANLLQRHFDWASNTLWFEEIPNARDPSRTMYFLGGKDDILNAEVRLACLVQLWTLATYYFPASASSGISHPTV